MRHNRALIVSVPLALLATGSIATAQTAEERRLFEPMFDATLEQLNRTTEDIEETEAELAQATDLVSGCGLLEEDIAHLEHADKLLGDLENYADRLNRRDQLEAVQAQQEVVGETLEMRQGDFDRMCQDLPES